MKMSLFHIGFVIGLYLIQSEVLYAQEIAENTVNQAGYRYIDINIRLLEKYNQKLANKQCRILNRLERKEQRLDARLKQDSAAHEQYAEQTLTFDSIGKLSKQPASKSKRPDPGIDSLKKVLRFTGPGNSRVQQAYKHKLETLDKELSHREHINELIRERGKSLRQLDGSTGGKVSGFKTIEKQVHYGGEKMKALKRISEEPSHAEEMAFEYLQGTEGFDRAMQGGRRNVPVMTGNSGNETTTAAAMEAAGVQTKQLVNKSLVQQLGAARISTAQERTSKQVKDWQARYRDPKEKISEGRTGLQQFQIQETPSFKVNPMREKLFRQRIEKQATLNTSRASVEKPAILEAGFMVGFKHTEQLSYGIGFAGAFGLGSGWSNIRLSFEGLGIRTYTHWEWQYGFGAYAGYERKYRIAFSKNEDPDKKSLPAIIRTNNQYTESVLIGLTKQYKITPEWNGAIQVLWDVWWKQNGLKTPLVFRVNYYKK